MRRHRLLNQSRFLVLERIPNRASRPRSLRARRVAADEQGRPVPLRSAVGPQTRATLAKNIRLDPDRSDEQTYTNEIGVCIPLLAERPALTSRVMTGDAMLTSRGLARYLLGRAAAGLHPRDRGRRRPTPGGAEDAAWLPGDAANRGHRPAERLPPAGIRLPRSGQAFRIERAVEHWRKGTVVETRRETAIGIPSLTRDPADARALLADARGRWAIETVPQILDHRNHGNEDRCRLRKGSGPENRSALRRLAIAVIQCMGKPVAPTLRQLRGSARMVLDDLRLTANARHRIAGPE